LGCALSKLSADVLGERFANHVTGNRPDYEPVLQFYTVRIVRALIGHRVKNMRFFEEKLGGMVPKGGIDFPSFSKLFLTKKLLLSG
jgi:hypothetical protein